MRPEALEAIFVQREALAQRLTDLIRESACSASKHHTLLIGPRGIGKTHLIALIYYRIQKMADLKDRLLIAWLREEEWGVSSFLDLLFRMLQALHAEYSDTDLAEQVESLYEHPDEAEAKAARLLLDYIGDRPLLIVTENLDEIFAGLDEDGQQRLRAFIQENSVLTLLATSQGLFNGISLQTSPFYGFFHIHHLDGLELEEAVDLLTRIAALSHDRDLAALIPTPLGRSRIRAVHHLAGGSHRVYVIFSGFLTSQTLDELVEPLLQTLDELTPYYQARMAWLSPQQRKIVAYLCEIRHAIPVKAIAQRCFMSHQTASGQLKILRELGYVRPESVGRESYYELREPLMRLSIEVKKNRGEPIRLLVDFLRFWHSREELQQRLKSLHPEATLDRQYIQKAIQLTEAETEDPLIAPCLKDYNTYYESQNFDAALQTAEELIVVRGNAGDWFRQGYVLGELGRIEEELKAYDKAIQLEPDHASAWYNKGVALGKMGRHEEALKACDKATQLDPDHVSAWNNKGVALDRMGRYEEALKACDKATQLDPDHVSAWNNKGVALYNMGRYEEALKAYDKAIQLEPDYVYAWNNKGIALARMGRYEEAEKAFHRSMEINPENPYPFFKSTQLLFKLNRRDEGILALDDALSRFSTSEKQVANCTENIVRDLFNGPSDPDLTRTLIEHYQIHSALDALGQGLVWTIAALNAESLDKAQTWRDTWQELGGKHKALQLPLRLLDAAVRHRETKDPRILLQLPIEERKVLEEILEQTESSEGE